MNPELLQLSSVLIDIPRGKQEKFTEHARRGELVLLTKKKAVSRQYYTALATYQQRILRIIAIGQSVRRSILLGHAAASVLGMWTANPNNVIGLSTPSGKHPKKENWPHGCEYRKRTLDPRVIEVVMGIHVTDPLETWLEIAREQGFVGALVAADWLLRNGYTRKHLHTRLQQSGRFVGIKHARKSLECATYGPESPWESYARALLIEAGIIDVRTQFRIGKFEVDLLIADWLVIEIDGDMKYAENATRAIIAERKREKWIRNQGYEILRYSPTDLIREPQRFLREIRAALLRKAAMSA